MNTEYNIKYEGCVCQVCRKYFKVDILVEDELWDRIKPIDKPSKSGLICGVCIISILEQLGFDSFTLIKIQNTSSLKSINKEFLKDLKSIRNYFGEHDKTLFEHRAYAILDSLIKQIEQLS